MKPIRVGIAQINPTVGDFEANQAKICDAIDRADRVHCDLVIFSELAVCGYPVWDLANKKSFVDANLRTLNQIVRYSRGKRPAVLVGFIDRGKGVKSRNALALIHRGKLVLKRYKSLLPTYDVFLEEIFFEPAQKREVFDLCGSRLGTTICEDIWDTTYPVKPVDELARQGAEVIINLSASPFHKTVLSLREKIIREKSRKHHVYFVYVNQVGGQDTLVFDGRSMICDPKGRIVFRAEAFKEDLYVVDLPFRGKTRLLGEEDPIVLMYHALTLGIRDYVCKNGFQKVVVGLSGGVDSALTAVLAVDALGKENVIGVTMPGPFSSPGSIDDSKQLAENLGIEFRVRPITRLYEEKLHELAALKQKEKGIPGRVREEITPAMENLQARLRTLQLMYISNDEGCLVLSTGNKSELAMGYCTLYGDMCGGLSVLGDVYKTDVYRLARYRNRIAPIIPKAILTKPPSAELRPNQTDQDTLPPYALLDDILHGYIEENLSRTEIVRRLAKRHKGANLTETVRSVIAKVDHNEYKRSQAAPILRVTQKAWFGRRMPITNRFKGQ